MAKSLQRIEARRLRREEGLGYREISRRTDVAKSTISRWCGDIQLTLSQIEKLNSQKGKFAGQIKGANVLKERRIALIESFKDEGKMRYSSIGKREFFTAGLALYWAEGFKKGCHAGFCNTDPLMMKLIIRWFFTFFNLNFYDLRFRVDINESHRFREKEVVDYWVKTLGIPESRFQKTSFKQIPNKKVYENFSEHYGTLRFEILRPTRVSYKILGLIFGLAQADFRRYFRLRSSVVAAEPS